MKLFRVTVNSNSMVLNDEICKFLFTLAKGWIFMNYLSYKW